MSVVLVWNVCSQVCKSAEVSVQSSACVCACVCAEHPSTLTFPPLPQSCSCPHSHSYVTTTSQPPSPLCCPSIARVCPQTTIKRQGRGLKKCATHTHTLLLKSMDQCVQSRTGGGRAEEDNDEWRKEGWKLDEEEEKVVVEEEKVVLEEEEAADWVSDKATQRNDKSSWKPCMRSTGTDCCPSPLLYATGTGWVRISLICGSIFPLALHIHKKNKPL